jgi:glyoxylase-like metal-dependent hydrolase (beta-lactamase superfamily II)
VTKPLAAGLDYVDLNFLGKPEIIATAVLQGPGGVALIDPGPSTTVESLRASLQRKGIVFGDIGQLLLTHIHLDHAGVTGTMVRENPAIEVFVHARGAPHMSNPAKLLASATRLYGEADMQRLWGEFLAVPPSNLRVLTGGETITAGGRHLEVAYTPGHASHHVSYFDRASRVAFVGDTAGIRRHSPYVMPPTPPPDIDLDAWRESEAKILAWDPDTLFLTHFGPFHGARTQFQDLRDNIEQWNRIVRRLIADSGLSEEQREDLFVEETTRELRRGVGEQEAAQYARAGRLDYSWQGLARYWRKRGGPEVRQP